MSNGKFNRIKKQSRVVLCYGLPTLLVSLNYLSKPLALKPSFSSGIADTVHVPSAESFFLYIPMENLPLCL